MLNLLMARHGQSVWNADGRWQGQADPPLSDLGRAQARDAALNAGSFDAIVASDLERALHTATIISEATGVGPVLIDPRLKERHVGEYEGLTVDQIEQKFPGQLEARHFPPGWEPTEQFVRRTLEALDGIVEHTNGSGDVLAISHGGVIYALERHLGIEHERIANLWGRWFHHDGKWRLGERVQLADDDIAVESQDIL